MKKETSVARHQSSSAKKPTLGSQLSHRDAQRTAVKPSSDRNGNIIFSDGRKLPGDDRLYLQSMDSLPQWDLSSLAEELFRLWPHG